MSSTSSHSGGNVVESPELSKLRKICGYGHIFLILVTIFCTLLLALSIVATPELILFFANYTNEAGKLMGDVSGLPPYFGFAGYLISLPYVFVWNYLTIWITMVFYYVYGSIEAKKRATTQTTQP